MIDSSKKCKRASGSILLALTFGSLAIPDLAEADPIVITEQGPIRGVETSDVRLFLGIPYAAPPIGELRWKPPAIHPKWSGVFDATRFGGHCPQTAHFVGTPSTNEDCLFLNVYAPATAEDEGGQEQRFNAQADDAPRPRGVMVWIHGGALTAGESDDFDARRLASLGEVIVVTINYRLGALGFLAHPALTAESPVRASGNYGIMDQQLALKWVQRNISSFGGDPAKITVFGESAGGLSVLANLASPLAAGLFERAIVQSGTYELALPSLSSGEAQGAAFASAVGCPDQTAQCLRAASVPQILASQGFATPVVDGFVLPLSLQIAGATGRFNRVPVINGTNHDEARFQIALGELAGQIVTDAQYPAVVSAAFGPMAGPLVLAQYPLTDYLNPDEALAAIETDSSFACPARLADQALSHYTPVFAYEFNDENAPEIFLPPVSYPYGAAHGSELQYFFAGPSLTHRPGPIQELDRGQIRLSRAMIRYWTQFAKNGDPNGAVTPRWAKYDGAFDEFLSLAPRFLSPEFNFASSHRCNFWSSLFPNSPHT